MQPSLWRMNSFQTTYLGGKTKQNKTCKQTASPSNLSLDMFVYVKCLHTVFVCKKFYD